MEFRGEKEGEKSNPLVKADIMLSEKRRPTISRELEAWSDQVGTTAVNTIALLSNGNKEKTRILFADNHGSNSIMSHISDSLSLYENTYFSLSHTPATVALDTMETLI